MFCHVMRHSLGQSGVHAGQASTDAVLYCAAWETSRSVALRRVGQSDPHAGRSFQSFAADVAQVADKLGIKTFFVVGVR